MLQRGHHRSIATPQCLCPVCGNTDWELIIDTTDRAKRLGGLKVEHAGSSRLSIGSIQVLCCSVCGLGQQNPMPSPESLASLYSGMRDELYLVEASGRRQTFRRCLRLLLRYTDRASGVLLDVGCSTGIFMELAQEAGWSVSGVEPSKWLAERAQERFGVRVLSTTFEAARLAEQSFDVVTMWDVLEHTAEPAAIVDKAAHLLRPGGILALNVPNIESVIARLMSSRWPLLLPEHLYYFSPASLRLLLAQHGFSVLRLHLHPVHFSIGYLLHRLSQHNLPGIQLIRTVTRTLRLQDKIVPALMGESTVIAVRDISRTDDSQMR